MARSSFLIVFAGLSATIVLSAAGGSLAADVWKAGSSEVVVNPTGEGGYSIGFSYQYVSDDCVSSGTPGDMFSFTNYLLVDNTNGVQAITVVFTIAVYEFVGGTAGAPLSSDSSTLTAGASEVVTGVEGGGAVEYTGWNGAPACGGNFLVVQSTQIGAGGLYTNSVVY